ncbi:MAG TPA: MerR family transcriptional regulator [Bacteroidales bacterium]|nr:MerR family transcriptional regulator [Bacteroidales bacterium]
MPYKEKKIEKLYYSIGEVAEMLDVPVSTVRFWENEFDVLKPMKNKKGNRLFTPGDIKNLKIIYHLLKEQGMTLSGAKKKLTERWEETNYKFEINESLQNIKSMLLEIKETLI